MLRLFVLVRLQVPAETEKGASTGGNGTHSGRRHADVFIRLGHQRVFMNTALSCRGRCGTALYSPSRSIAAHSRRTWMFSQLDHLLTYLHPSYHVVRVERLKSVPDVL